MTTSDKNKDQQKPKRPYSRKGVTNNPNGRPKGTTNKISGAAIIAALEQYSGKSYAEQLAENYAVCVRSDDRQMIAKYDQMFLNKVVADKTEVDMLSAGQAIQAAFAFVPRELDDWKTKE